MTTDTANHPLVILRRDEVERRTGLSKTAIYGLIKAGDFPKPIEITSRARGWLDAEISAWIGARVANSRASR